MSIRGINKINKKKKENETKPAKFKQDKNEFNKIYNQVKDFARKNATGIQKKQLENDLRKRLGLQPKVQKHNYRVLQERGKKVKEIEQLNLQRTKEEQLVMANSLLPTKTKKKREKTLKTTSGSLHDGILRFDMDKDNQIKFHTNYSFDKKRGKNTIKASGFGSKGKGKKSKGKGKKKR